MKRNQVDAILTVQTKRRNVVTTFVSLIIIVFILSLSFLGIYVNRSKGYYVSYDETSKIDYKVFLKENEFFDNNYIGTNQQYIASLIEYIEADFYYDLSLEEKDIEYKYSYRIEANLNVKQKGTNLSLYNNDIELLKEIEKTSNLKNVSIEENIKIDYNYYNDLIKKFINVYELENIESTLTVNMYVNIIGSCEDFVENKEKESVMSLQIPLSTKTMAIDINDNLIVSENNLMQCKSIYTNNYIFIVLSGIFMFIDTCLIGLTFRYIIKTRTAEDLYEKELKKILNNYGSYIQTLSNDFAFSEYQLLKVETFTDMLEIRDTIRQPILMKQNPEKTGAYFVIPSNSKILYVYRLKVGDLKKEF